MIYGDSGCDGYPSVSSDKRSITGRDRLTWRKDGVRLLLFHRSDQNHLVSGRPDARRVIKPVRKTRRERSRSVLLRFLGLDYRPLQRSDTPP